METVLEGDVCVQEVQQAGFPDVQSIQYTQNVPLPPPSEAPTKSPTRSPTLPPTASPIRSPTAPPTTLEPTAIPTVAPTEPPTTQEPTTLAPVTDNPTRAPVESPTTDSPTAAPVPSPTTESPTAAPVISPTTESPTAAPVKSPTTESPILAPVESTESPAAAPVVDSPTSTESPATESPANGSSPTTSPTTPNGVLGGVKGVEDSSSQQSSSPPTVPIVGAVLGVAVLAGVFGFVLWRRRVQQDHSKEVGAGLIETFSMYDDDEDDDEDDIGDDLEQGSAMGLSSLDSLKRQGASFQPAYDEANATKESGLVPPVAAVAAAPIMSDGTPNTAAAMTRNSSQQTESLSSNEEEVPGAVEHDDISSSSDDGADNDNDRQGILSAKTRRNGTYDTRSVMSGDDAVTINPSQEVVYVRKVVEDDNAPTTKNVAQTSWKNRWIRPTIVASIQSLRPKGITCNNEYYISSDESSSCSSTPMNNDAARMLGILDAAAEEGDAGTDYEPDEDWNPDDTSVSAADDMSNGELSFQAKPVSLQKTQTPPLDGLDILEKLRLPPTPSPTAPPSPSQISGQRGRSVTPRAFLK